MIEYKVTVDENRTRWFLNGKLHREDGPAVELSNGSKFWYVRNKLHRENGPAIEYVNGNKEWYLEGKRHRLDEPAVEDNNGNKEWHLEGKRHRLDGPAVEDNNGIKYWFIEGKEYTEEEFKEYVNKKTIIIDGEEIKISNESFENLKKSLLGEQMNKQTIKIIVEGLPGTGKSSISKCIADALQKQGLEIDYNDCNGCQIQYSKKEQEKINETLKDRINSIKGQTKIEIHTNMTK